MANASFLEALFPDPEGFKDLAKPLQDAMGAVFKPQSKPQAALAQRPFRHPGGHSVGRLHIL